MAYNENELALIYINKIGYNAKGCGYYEFIFSKDPDNIDVEGWCWDLSPACDNALPPTEEHIDALINLKTNKINLFCLHEAVDRPYMHGFHTIHALAYEDVDNLPDSSDGHSSYENMFESNDEDKPILVFHYGMSLAKIKEKLITRDITLNGDEFVDISSIRFK